MFRYAVVSQLIGLLVVANCKGKDTPAEPPKVVVVPTPEKGSAAPVVTDAALAPSGSGGSSDEPTPGEIDNSTPGVIHGDKWQDEETPRGGFKAFKETWIYVDGEPVSCMLMAELPDIPVAWHPEEEELDFVRAIAPPKIRKYYVRRWRLVDYLKAVGVPIAKVKVVYLHSGSGVIEVPGPVLRKFADGLTFDLTGMDMTKSRFFFPKDMPHFGNFDRYAGVSVIVNKEPLKVDEHKQLIQDGKPVNGIPYHGNPERGGIRIYRDGRLALVIKRNTLGSAGRVAPTEPKWKFAELLKANGASADGVAAADIVYKGARKRVDDRFFKDMIFATNSQASGEILLGDGVPANAILLYSKGKVPKEQPLPPEEKERK